MELEDDVVDVDRLVEMVVVTVNVLGGLELEEDVDRLLERVVVTVKVLGGLELEEDLVTTVVVRVTVLCGIELEERVVVTVTVVARASCLCSGHCSISSPRSDSDLANDVGFGTSAADW